MTRRSPRAGRARRLLACGWAVATVTASAVIASTGAPAAGATAARPDFNGDGRADLAISGYNAVAVRYGGSNASEVLRAPVSGDVEFGAALATGDFDGNGYDDLAVGAPWVSSSSIPHHGAVWVYRGGPHGLVDAEGRTSAIKITQNTAGVPGTNEKEDNFGYALAAGPVVGSRYDDLAIGSVGETLDGRPWAGMVSLIPGAARGLDTTRTHSYHQNTPGIPGAPEPNDRFGASLAIGDITGDGRADLAIGIPGENSTGAVQVLKGTKTWPATAKSTLVTATPFGLRPTALRALDKTLTGDAALLGWSLAIADTTGDGRAELIAGAPYARVGSADACGAVVVLRGTTSGITGTAGQAVSQSTLGVPGSCEKADFWGWSVTAGDLTGDKRAEVAVGAYGESIGDRQVAGMVTVLRPAKTGVTGTGSFSVTQQTANVPGTAETDDGFGWSVAMQDVNRDGRADLLVGAPGEEIGGEPSGMLAILISSRTGRPTTGSSELLGGDFTDEDGPVYLLGNALGAAPNGPSAGISAGDATGATGGTRSIGTPGTAVGAAVLGATGR